MQNLARRRREQSRRLAWIDGNARQVGYMDAKLYHGKCPYPVGTPQADAWQAGYADAHRPPLTEVKA